MSIQPIKFRPILKFTPWGGKRLIEYKKLDKTLNNIGECWELSGINGSESVVAGGIYDGYTLTRLINELKSRLLGSKVYEAFGNHFPLLIKYIDAKDDLSIQVHPDDVQARKAGYDNGKSEMWYIVDAGPHSSILYGLQQDATPEEFIEKAKSGTVCEMIYKHHVAAGDCYYIPAGQVHAICADTFLIEIQQSSDVTYRIFDYNRPGLDGKPRELHTELAAKAIDYAVYTDYKTEHRDDIDVANMLLNTPYFSVKVIEATSSFHRNMVKYDSFIIIMNMRGDCHIRIRSTQDSILLPEGCSCLIPAAIADYDLIPTGSTTKVLEAFINNKKTIGKIVSDFLHFS